MDTKKELTEEQKLKLKQKEERRLAFEAKRAAELKQKENIDLDSNKSKADLRKERREKQEAQRSVKKNANAVPVKRTVALSSNLSPVLSTQNKPQQITPQTSVDKSNEGAKLKPSPIAGNRLTKKGHLFPHIPKREQDVEALIQDFGFDGLHLHPSVICVGLQMNSNIITHTTSRSMAFLAAFRDEIDDYEVTPGKEISRDMENKLDKVVTFLEKCRPISITMRNVIQIVRKNINRLPPDVTEKEAKSAITSLLSNFSYDEIVCGLDSIKENGAKKIHDGDIVMTYGDSMAVRHIFSRAKELGKKFRVIVVDSRPRLEGQNLFNYLKDIGVKTEYIWINALAHVMSDVTKVLLEAETLLANGYMMANMGSSQITMVAKSQNVPVLVCCESYRFSERVYSDSFVFNEAAPIEEFFSKKSNTVDLESFIQKNEQNVKSASFHLLNLYYDVTPPEFIDMVISEMGFLSCNSVPAIIRRNIHKFQLDV